MVFGLKKTIREAKKSINRSWYLIVTIVDLEIDFGAKRPPLPDITIPGATVDQMNFCLDQVSTNSPILYFNTCFVIFGRVLGVVVALQRVGPSNTRVVQGQPAGTRGCRLDSPWATPA